MRLFAEIVGGLLLVAAIWIGLNKLFIRFFRAESTKPQPVEEPNEKNKDETING